MTGDAVFVIIDMANTASLICSFLFLIYYNICYGNKSVINHNDLDRIYDMKTAEIINNICSHLGIAKADLAKRMGLHPSSLYRKLSKESMTFEELQKCLDILGVSLELEFHYPDGDILNSQTNHEQLIDRMAILEKELEAAGKVDEF